MPLNQKLLIGLLGLGASQPLWADGPAPLGVDISSALQYTNMREVDSANTLVHETGWLPGLAGGIYRDQGDWRLEGSLYGFTGDLNYNGELQDGQPHQTTTDTDYAGGQLSATWHQDGWATTISGGYHYWHRYLLADSTAGASVENYSWYQLGLGISHRFTLASAVFLQPQVDLFYNLHINQTAAVPGYDTATLHPGGNQGSRLSLLLGRQVDARTSIGVRPYWQMYQFERSADVGVSVNGQATTGQIYQPEERYRQLGISLELERRFR